MPNLSNHRLSLILFSIRHEIPYKLKRQQRAFASRQRILHAVFGIYGTVLSYPPYAPVSNVSSTLFSDRSIVNLSSIYNQTSKQLVGLVESVRENERKNEKKKKFRRRARVYLPGPVTQSSSDRIFFSVALYVLWFSISDIFYWFSCH